MQQFVREYGTKGMLKSSLKNHAQYIKCCNSSYILLKTRVWYVPWSRKKSKETMSQSSIIGCTCVGGWK